MLFCRLDLGINVHVKVSFYFTQKVNSNSRILKGLINLMIWAFNFSLLFKSKATHFGDFDVLISDTLASLELFQFFLDKFLTDFCELLSLV